MQGYGFSSIPIKIQRYARKKENIFKQAIKDKMQNNLS